MQKARKKALQWCLILVAVVFVAFATVPLTDNWPFILKYGMVVIIALSSAMAVRYAEVAARTK